MEGAHLTVLEPCEVNQLSVLIYPFGCHGSDDARVRNDYVLLLLAFIEWIGSYILSHELLDDLRPRVEVLVVLITRMVSFKPL